MTDLAGKRAQQEVELAEAELALIKQEQVIRDLLTTDAPSPEATERLHKLRDVVAHLSAKRSRWFRHCP